jgi:type II secretory pathway component PulK
MILVAVLVIITLLTLMVASFVFRMNAESQAAKIRGEEIQSRFAAMSGIERAVVILQDYRLDPTRWTDNEDVFRRQLIFDPFNPEAHKLTDDSDESFGQENEAGQAWRYSVMADDPNGDAMPIFGLTDESSKLNVNVAPRQMLEALPGMNAVLASALIDWRDSNDDAEPGGAETDYYETLKPPSSAKNAPFDTVEELLMVRGFSARMLFGEDVNRNGLLDPNEDDGDDTVPPDNADGKLDIGIAGFMTVYSRELNVSNDNRPRINVNGSPNEVRAAMTKDGFRPEVIEFVANARNEGGRGVFASPADLLEYQGEGGASPVKLEDMPKVMDRLTANRLPGQFGLINVNTAPREVLGTIPQLVENDVDAILAARRRLSGEEMATLAWLVTRKTISPATFKAVSNFLTARSSQFTVESIGFKDDLGIQSRIQAVLEMRGPQAQIIYFRDLTSIGPAYNPWDTRTRTRSGSDETVG